MAQTFFFYDLETSGFNARNARIMQFAGQRTTTELEPVGDPVNVLIKLSDDCLPDPDAVLVTGITPQQTLADGITEAEFLRMFTQEVATPDTIFVGYNSVRFDDEFMRFLHYRNFYDPYEWQWRDGRSKWDLLDVVRLTRALRPDGIEWPFDATGKPTNRLELLTSLNKLEHAHAHDALSDVMATIAVARLIRNKQTKLFDYLLSMRDKKKVAELIDTTEPFVYASGKYSGEFEKTTVAIKLGNHPKKQGAFVYDLRHDPLQYKDLSPEQLADLWRWKREPDAPRLPVKMLQYNHCPAVAPLGVLDLASQKRLKVDLAVIQQNTTNLRTMKDFAQKIQAAATILDGEQQTAFLTTEQDVDAALYDGFFADADKTAMSVVRAAKPEELSDLGLQFVDYRLRELFPLYKARNFAKHLSPEEREAWETFRSHKLIAGGKQSQLAKYLARLGELAATENLSAEKQYLLEELQLYAESIMPEQEG